MLPPEPELFGAAGMQTRVGHQFGHHQQHVLRGGPAVGGGGGQPSPVPQCLPGEIIKRELIEIKNKKK